MTSALELLSIAALLVNLLLWRHEAVAGLVGPIHGALYLTVVVTALMTRGLLPRTRWQAVIPVLGGAFTLRNVQIENRRERQRVAQ